MIHAARVLPFRHPPLPRLRTEVCRQFSLLSISVSHVSKFLVLLSPQPDTSTSSPPFISTVPSTKETTYPSQLTTPITTNVAAKSFELLDEALLIPPHPPLAIVPKEPRSFNVRRKPPPSLSNLAKSSPASIIAGQSSSDTCGGSTSPASSSLAYKGVSMPSSPSPSMDQKVKPFLGDESYPLSSSKPRSVTSTSSGSSHVTMNGLAPQFSCPDLPSPPMMRTSRLSMKRLLPKLPSSSPPNSRKLVKRPSRVPSSVDPKADVTSPTTGDNCESAETFGDPVCPGASILSAFSKVLRSSDVVLSKEHRSSILTSDMRLSRVQPDFQASPLVPTSPHNHSSVCEKRETSRGIKGSSQPFEKASMMKGEEAGDPPGRRRRNVLRKRSHPCMIGVSRSTSTLGNPPSPLDRDGCQIAASLSTDQDEPVHRSRRPDETDRIPISQPQSRAMRRTSELEIPHGIALGIQDGVVSNLESFAPPSLIAIQSKAQMTEGPDESSVLCNPLDDGKREGLIKCRSLLRSASMSEILLSNPGSVDCQVQNTETISHKEVKTRDRTSLRARQSLNLSIAKHPNELDEEKFRKSTAMKAGGGRLKKLMRKFSLSGSVDKRGERPLPLPVWAISTPMAFPSVIMGLNDNQSPSPFQAKARGRTSSGLAVSSLDTSSALQVATKSRPTYEIPILTNHPVSVPLDLHIVNPSVLDQTCEEEDRTQSSVLQNISALPSSFPKMPPEGEWMRSSSPDLELAALPPPRRAPKASTGSPPRPYVEADSANVTHISSPIIPVFSIDNTINSFPLCRKTTLATISPSPDSLNLRQSHSVANTSLAMNSADSLSDIPDLSSCGPFMPSISITPPSHPPLTNPQRPNLFIEDARPPLFRITTNNTPPHQPFPNQEYSSEAQNTPSNYTAVQLVPSLHNVAEETDPNSNAYLTFTRSLNATSSVVFRPGTANTFGGSENIRPGTSDSVQSAISTPPERFKTHSPLAGYSFSTGTPY